MSHHQRRGFSRLEAVVACGCLLVACSVISVAFGQDGPRIGNAKGGPKTAKDANQIRAIHQGLIVFAREMNGQFPRPGLINRLAAPETNQQTPGRGPEDVEANTTSNFFSILLMNNYIAEEVLISPVERNPKVKLHACGEYNYEAYDVKHDAYWDPNFKADLEQASGVSYAHLPMFGDRMEKQWRDSHDALFPALSNRGPRDGLIDPNSFTCGPHGNWAGNVVFNDNHSMFLDQTSPDGLFYGSDDARKVDNIFSMQDGPGGADAVLAFTKKMAKTGPELQFD